MCVCSKQQQSFFVSPAFSSPEKMQHFFWTQDGGGGGGEKTNTNTNLDTNTNTDVALHLDTGLNSREMWEGRRVKETFESR